ncbi:response regulator transcription factor [Streptomyces sp. NPDC094032]|uniref:helix-turn-helix transcriptional regulator n=1 Tax=Streptomyces sp. NPDC094032 TaxID=3155308 RepID=UPI0033271FC1
MTTFAVHTLEHASDRLGFDRLYSQLRVLVALENGVARWGVCSMLDALPTVRATTGCGTLQEAAAQLSETPYDVLILSATLADEELAGLRESCQGGPKVLLLLHHPSDEALARAASQHVDGFLLEAGLTPEALQDALGRLLRGEMPMPDSMARELLSMVRRRGPAPARGLFLTPREQQALDLLAAGCSNKQIARRLGISEHGAKRHVGNVLAKLNCPNRTLAVAMALREGLVTEER